MSISPLNLTPPVTINVNISATADATQTAMVYRNSDLVVNVENNFHLYKKRELTGIPSFQEVQDGSQYDKMDNGEWPFLLHDDYEGRIAYQVKKVEFTQSLTSALQNFSSSVKEKLREFTTASMGAIRMGSTNTLNRESFGPNGCRFGAVMTPFFRVGNYETSGYVALKLNWSRSNSKRQTIIGSFIFCSSLWDGSVIPSELVDGMTRQIMNGYGSYVSDANLIGILAEIRKTRVKFLKFKIFLDTITDETFVQDTGTLFDRMVNKMYNLHLASYFDWMIIGNNQFPKFNVKYFDFDAISDFRHDVLYLVEDNEPGVKEDLSGFFQAIVPIAVRRHFLKDLFLRRGVHSSLKLAYAKSKLNQIGSTVLETIRLCTYADLSDERNDIQSARRISPYSALAVAHRPESLFPYMIEVGRVVTSASHVNRPRRSFITKEKYEDLFGDIGIVKRDHSERCGLCEFDLDREFFDRLTVGITLVDAYGFKQANSSFYSTANPVLYHGEDLHVISDKCVTKEDGHECRIPWFESTIPYNSLAADRIMVQIQKRPCVVMCLKLFNSNTFADKFGKKAIQSISHALVVPLPYGEARDSCPEKVNFALNDGISLLLAKGLLLHLENLVFEMFKFDYFGWVSIVKMILDCKDTRHDKSFFNVINPIIGREALNKYGVDEMFTFSSKESEKSGKRGRDCFINNDDDKDDESFNEECPIFKKARKIVSTQRSASLSPPSSPQTVFPPSSDDIV